MALEELQDLPPIDGSTAEDNDNVSTPSVHPPATAATIGSLPAHDQLETPLAEIAEREAAGLAKGDKSSEGELKDDVSNAEKSRTTLTEGGGVSTEGAGGKEATEGVDGMSEVKEDSPAEGAKESAAAHKVRGCCGDVVCDCCRCLMCDQPLPGVAAWRDALLCSALLCRVGWRRGVVVMWFVSAVTA